MPDHLDHLIERLSVGDMSAAESLYAELAPYLRMIVRRNLPRRLRSKFDSIDVVQSVWADFIAGLQNGRWQFDNVAQVRAFLLKSTRHRLIDRVRQFRVAAAHERSLTNRPSTQRWQSHEPRPSQNAQANDLWQHLLAACRPEHRELLQMKSEGAPLAAIADRTGLHVDSIRRILRQLARDVSLRETENDSLLPGSGTSVQQA